jgi:hypothetical protein
LTFFLELWFTINYVETQYGGCFQLILSLKFLGKYKLSPYVSLKHNLW